MEIIADLHLHSKYSRAVSQQMTLPVMAQWARVKGLDILSTSDWTHPLWFREISALLEEASEGLYKIKNQKLKIKNEREEKEIRFLLSTEISSMYTHNGKFRRIHNLVFVPSLEIAEKISKELVRRGGNLNADGRPIIGLSSKELLELVLSIDRHCILIPAHIWTPHFGMYGSKSGYDTLEESFGNLSRHIYGIETGLSSDPLMNWQVKELDTRSILSFSDAHSPAKMGREVTVFSFDKALVEVTYKDIGKAIARPRIVAEKGEEAAGSGKIVRTIEFYPEEGKYHYSGHRNCKVVQSAQETKENGLTCPVCKRTLTEGVLYRVGQLAQDFTEKETVEHDTVGIKWIIDPEKKRPPYVKLVPLNEIIAESLQTGVQNEKVKLLYQKLCHDIAPELDILLKTPIKEIAAVAGPKLAEGIEKVRKGAILIKPGYDNEYGVVKIWPASSSIGGSEEELADSAQTKEDRKKEKKTQLGLEF